VYVPQLLRFVVGPLERSPHLEFDLVWVNALLMAHGRIEGANGEFAAFSGRCKRV